VGSQHQVGVLALDDIDGVLLGRDDDGVADNGGEAVDLSTELDLDRLSLLELYGSILLVGPEWGVGSDVRAGRDGGRMGET
jgi:hypothetical protein